MKLCREVLSNGLSVTLGPLPLELSWVEPPWLAWLLLCRMKGNLRLLAFRLSVLADLGGETSFTLACKVKPEPYLWKWIVSLWASPKYYVLHVYLFCYIVDNTTHLFLRCWTLPRHLKEPLTMMASRVHTASHSSML